VALPLVPAWRSEADEAHAPGLDEAGRPVGQARETLFPAPDDPYAFVLELDAAAAPPYRPGDLLVVSPAAALRPGDAVALRTLAGMLHLGRLRRQDGARVVLTRHGQTDLSVAAGAVAWISRVLWASQ
jgi:phage repressor protein C with HTH and peptisase S24 domain